METESPFIDADRVIELNAVTFVDLFFSFVIGPMDIELDDVVWNDEFLEEFLAPILLFVLRDDWL